MLGDPGGDSGSDSDALHLALVRSHDWHTGPRDANHAGPRTACYCFYDALHHVVRDTSCKLTFDEDLRWLELIRRTQFDAEFRGLMQGWTAAEGYNKLLQMLRLDLVGYEWRGVQIVEDSCDGDNYTGDE